MIINCHTHTNFSPDGKATLQEMAAEAFKNGVEYLAITDHFDPEYCDPKVEGIKNFRLYKQKIMEVKKQYEGKMYISFGIEIGYLPQGEARAAKAIEDFGFEYVINSVHQVDGAECYYPQFFVGKLKSDAYVAYLNAVEQSLEARYDYDAIGHLGYVTRNAPYGNKFLTTDYTADIITRILCRIIEKQKILEINTSTRGASTPVLPDVSILKRYHELGGTRVTFSSDAHFSKDILRGYKEACQIAREVGFTHFTIKKNGRYESVEID